MKFFYFTSFCIFLASRCCADSIDLSCFADEISLLANDTTIRKETLAYNKHHMDVHTIDLKWPSLKTTAPEVESIISNPASRIIKRYIESHSIEGEGFLIGLDGGLVAATNKTSDFYQGDEEQFLKPMKLPFGEAWTKQGIVDESAAALLIKVAVPVFSTDQTVSPKPKKREKPIGVLVVGLYEFVISMSDGCVTFDSEEELNQTTEQQSDGPSDKSSFENIKM